MKTKELLALRRKIQKRSHRGVLEEIARFVDQARLSYYRKCSEKMKDLEYKLADPDGYEADCLIGDIDRILKKIEKKGKPPTSTQKQMLAASGIALSIIALRQMGRRYTEVPSLLERTSKQYDNRRSRTSINNSSSIPLSVSPIAPKNQKVSDQAHTLHGLHSLHTDLRPVRGNIDRLGSRSMALNNSIQPTDTDKKPSGSKSNGATGTKD